jgi:hypothetical protein
MLGMSDYGVPDYSLVSSSLRPSFTYDIEFMRNGCSFCQRFRYHMSIIVQRYMLKLQSMSRHRHSGDHHVKFAARV